MVGIKIQDEWLDLPAEPEITLNIEADFSNLDSIEGTYTYSMDFPPTDKNHRLLKFAHVLQKQRVELPTIEKAELCRGGNELKTGNLVIESFEKNYSGFLQTDMSVLAKYKDKAIREILSGWEIPVELGGFSINPFDQIFYYTELANNRPNSPVVFPWAKLGNRLYNMNYKTIYNTDVFYALPFLRLTSLIQMLFESLGFRLENEEWHTKIQDFDKVILFNTKPLVAKYTNLNLTQNPIDGSANLDMSVTIADTIKVADHVPNFNLGDFVNGLRRTFGLFYQLNNKFKTVRIDFLEKILESKPYIEKTRDTIIPFSLKKQEYEGLTFEFAKDSKDKIVKDWLTARPDKVLEVNNLTDLPQPSVLNVIYYVRNLGEYWQGKINTYEHKHDSQTQNKKYLFSEYERIGFENMGTVKDLGKKKIQSPFSPVSKTNQLVFEHPKEVFKIGYNSDIDIYIQKFGFDFRRQADLRNPTKVEVMFVKADKYPKNVWFEVWEVNTQGYEGYIKLDYNGDEEVEIKVRYTVLYTVVEVGIEAQDTAQEIEGEKASNDSDFPAKLMMWHGSTQIPNSQLFYYSAGADNHDIYGEKRTSFAIRWEKDDNLFRTFFKNYRNYLKNRVLVQYKQFWTETEIRNFDPTIKQRIAEVMFFVAKIQVVLRGTGIEPATVSLYLANSSLCEQEITINEYKQE